MLSVSNHFLDLSANFLLRSQDVCDAQNLLDEVFNYCLQFTTQTHRVTVTTGLKLLFELLFKMDSRNGFGIGLIGSYDKSSIEMKLRNCLACHA